MADMRTLQELLEQAARDIDGYWGIPSHETYQALWDLWMDLPEDSPYEDLTFEEWYEPQLPEYHGPPTALVVRRINNLMTYSKRMMKTIQRKDIPTEEVLLACRAYSSGNGPRAFNVLAEKYPSKVVYAKMLQLSDQGLLDYGTSVHSAWETLEGEIKLQELTDTPLTGKWDFLMRKRALDDLL